MTAVLAGLALAGCAALKTYTNDDLATADLDQLMWAQDQVADPAFELVDQPAFADADWQRVHAAGERLALAAPRLKEPKLTQGPEFDAFAEALAKQGTVMVETAAKKDVEGAKAALRAAEAACDGCHAKFR